MLYVWGDNILKTPFSIVTNNIKHARARALYDCSCGFVVNVACARALLPEDELFPEEFCPMATIWNMVCYFLLLLSPCQKMEPSTFFG